MLDVSEYLLWPHMHKDIMNMAEEFTRYGENVENQIHKNTSKLLPPLTQSRQKKQLHFCRSIKTETAKKLLVTNDDFSKFPLVRSTKLTGRKTSLKFLRI